MKLEHFSSMPSFFDDVWAVPEDKEASIKLGLAKLSIASDGQSLRIVTRMKRHLVRLQDQALMSDIIHYLKRNTAHLAEVCRIAKNGHIQLQIAFFNGDLLDLDEVDINLDSELLARANKLGLRSPDLSALANLLEDKCTLKGSIYEEGEYYFPLLTGGASDAIWKGNGFEEEQEVLLDNGFSLLGDNVQLAVKQSDTLGSLTASRISSGWSQKALGAIRLAKGQISLSDGDKKLQELSKHLLKSLLEDESHSSYLKTWDKYGDIEGELLLERARAVGYLPIPSEKALEVVPGGVKIFFHENLPRGIVKGSQLEVVDQMPVYLDDQEMDWKTYSEFLLESSNPQSSHNLNAAQKVVGQVVEVKARGESWITLDLEQKPLQGVHALVLSINGDKIQVERRMQARKLILEGNSANPQLGLLIEEEGKPSIAKRHNTIAPLTAFVREKVFAHPPTPSQELAIKVALNTPDIALIQGPPGTGKTTVIAAIIERLNQEYRKTGNYKGQILVSGFQHDAVENLLARLSINSLPSVKFGKKSGTEFSPDRVDQKIESWCDGIADNLRKQNPQLASSESLRVVRSKLALYQASPTNEIALSLLKQLQEFSDVSLDHDLSQRISYMIKELGDAENGAIAETISHVLALRCHERSFKDDGPERAMALYREMEDILDSAELALLRTASIWNESKGLKFLPELRALRSDLLKRYSRKRAYRVSKPREDVLAIVNQSIETLSKSKQFSERTDNALVDFLYELDHNKDGIKRSLAEYNAVFGATVQQSMGQDIRSVKLDSGVGAKRLSYDTVIIDEAARCSPRDILIPLSQAEKRIILVGDHRQLPHIIDEEIARQLEEGEQTKTEESMFEYLFSRLKKLESADGYQRTVTLDAQFRSHPLLGEFASKYFYEPSNEGYESPLPARLFGQSLKGVEDQACAWIHIPNRQGGEKRDSSRSGYRSCEAEAIAEKVNEWLVSQEGKELSFGVISFYKAQVNAVFKALSIYGITTKERGEWEVKDEYRMLPSGEERLRIGTVDSFQGMEFDVVFLSMVRTQNLLKNSSYLEQNCEDRKEQAKVFGHLMSPNRLCVSVTRQKRLLVVVGDIDLADHSIAKQAVPALYGYCQLVKERGVVL
ncbi:AAA domain-containing protein [Pseudoalteromonas sp. CnMc7-37]|uniref:DEAD/DEAH box helicase n=1 Tax=Pseudoalteromonas sp. CnMc7-37 TaxID=2954496 RepID=UPI002097AD1A|nr:AAA domain-containing protein [Pseudoalteromonas sp. CnMc7-37]MCO7205333.1 AAA domain-containing protein [Pseudoalteromonas sp. CnMc7-37]